VIRALIEEVTDGEVERLQDLQEGVEANLVFALLHAGEIGLMDADPLGEFHLSQLALTAKLPDLSTDELELGWLVRGHFVDFYAIEK
jgi:hypothetical protein